MHGRSHAAATMRALYAPLTEAGAPLPRTIVRKGAPETAIREEIGRLGSDLVLTGTGPASAAR